MVICVPGGSGSGGARSRQCDNLCAAGSGWWLHHRPGSAHHISAVHTQKVSKDVVTMGTDGERRNT